MECYSRIEFLDKWRIFFSLQSFSPTLFIRNHEKICVDFILCSFFCRSFIRSTCTFMNFLRRINNSKKKKKGYIVVEKGGKNGEKRSGQMTEKSFSTLTSFGIHFGQWSVK